MKQARITKLHPIFSPPKNEEAPFFDPCPKFQTLYHPKCELDRIISYLFLKQNHIEGKTFSQRRICKLDCTQTFDGPAKCRVLKIHPPDAAQINGWKNVGGELSYDFNNGWKTRLKDICTDIQEDIKVMRRVLMDEGEQKHDYKARIEYLRKYIEEINKMYHIVDLKEDVKRLRGIYRKSREEIKSYIKLKGTRFFEIVPQLKQVQKEPTLIDDFRVFKPLTDEKLQEKQKYLDDLFKHLNRNKNKQQEDQLKQLEQLDNLVQLSVSKIENNQLNSVTANKEIEKKFVFEEFIEESKQYEDEQIEEDDEINEQEKKQRPKRAFSQIISGRQQDRKSAAQEFNSQHYLFEVKDVNSFGQQIRLNRMNKIMNDMFKEQRNFSQELQQYSYNYIKHSNVDNISTNNIDNLQNVHNIYIIEINCLQRKRITKNEQVVSKLNGEKKFCTHVCIVFDCSLEIIIKVLLITLQINYKNFKLLMNNQVISAILKKSNIENKQISDVRQTGEKDLYYKQWEDKLKKREIQLDSKYQQLKLYSKQLKLQSEEIVKQKLELGEKIEKYNKLLEQIISQQNQPTKNGSLTPNTAKIRKYGINECQQRVASLLQKIRNTSKNSIKTQQQSYFGNSSEYEEVLFSKRQNHSSSFTGIVNLSNQEQQQPNKPEQQPEVQGELMNHQLSLQQMENSQRHFYSKVYEEMNKLKKQL